MDPSFVHLIASGSMATILGIGLKVVWAELRDVRAEYKAYREASEARIEKIRAESLTRIEDLHKGQVDLFRELSQAVTDAPRK